MRIVITAGHSNTDPGAVNGPHQEAAIAVKVRNALAHYLRAAKIEVVTDGTGDDNQSLASAVKLVKGADLALEIHMNAAASKQASGIETIAPPKLKALAQNLSKAIQSVTEGKLRGDAGWIDQSRSHRGKLAFVQAGGMIAELDFISNENGVSVVNANIWLIAKAMAAVLIEWVKNHDR